MLIGYFFSTYGWIDGIGCTRVVLSIRNVEVEDHGSSERKVLKRVIKSISENV